MASVKQIISRITLCLIVFGSESVFSESGYITFQPDSISGRIVTIDLTTLYRFYRNRISSLSRDTCLKNKSFMQSWDETTQQWNTAIKTSYLYYGDYYLKEKIDSSLYPEDSAWTPLAKMTYTYTPQKNLSTHQLHTWDIIKKEWYTTAELQFNYTPDGLPVLIIQQRANAIGEPLKNNVRTLFDYFPYSIFEELQLWNDTMNLWEKYSCRIDSFDIYQRLIELFTKPWDTDSNTWRNQNRNSYFYLDDSLDILGEDFYYYWEASEGAWDHQSIASCQYDSEGNLISIIIKIKKLNSTDFQYSGRTVYTYDAEGHILEDCRQRWDTTTSGWYNTQRDTFGFNDLGYLIEEKEQLWNDSTQTWTNGMRIYHEYSIITPIASSPDMNNHAVPIQISRTSHGIRIALPEKTQSATLSLYDLKGKLITTLSSEYTRKNSFFWDYTNNKGIRTAHNLYLLVIKHGNHLFTSKMVSLSQ